VEPRASLVWCAPAMSDSCLRKNVFGRIGRGSVPNSGHPIERGIVVLHPLVGPDRVSCLFFLPFSLTEGVSAQPCCLHRRRSRAVGGPTLLVCNRGGKCHVYWMTGGPDRRIQRRWLHMYMGGGHGSSIRQRHDASAFGRFLFGASFEGFLVCRQQIDSPPDAFRAHCLLEESCMGMARVYWIAVATFLDKWGSGGGEVRLVIIGGRNVQEWYYPHPTGSVPVSVPAEDAYARTHAHQ